MTSALPILYTPRAEPDYNALANEVIANRGFQAAWLKNPDGVSQGERWMLCTCGRGCWASPGCDICPARVTEELTKRRGEKIPRAKALYENLHVPFGWIDPKNVFMGPEGDLLHDNIEDDFLHEALDVVRIHRQHLFVMTTKRVHRLHLLNKYALPNLYVGVSVESQEFMCRAETLMDLPKGVKKILFLAPMVTEMEIPERVLRGVHWVICSPERGGLGRKPRPCKEKWLVDVANQVKSYDIPFFLDVIHSVARVERMGDSYREFPPGFLGKRCW